MQAKLTCTECGKWTHEGQIKRTEHSKKHPIYGTDFSIPLSEIIKDIRFKLVDLRGSLSDITFAFPGYRERLDTSEAGITLVLMALHGVMLEMKELEDAIH